MSLDSGIINDAINNYKCPCRERPFQTKPNLISHILHEHPQESITAQAFGCVDEKCKKVFFEKNALIRHLNSSHKVSATKKSIPPKEVYKFHEADQVWLKAPEASPIEANEIIVRNLLTKHKPPQSKPLTKRLKENPPKLVWNCETPNSVKSRYSRYNQKTPSLDFRLYEMDKLLHIDLQSFPQN